MKRNLDQLGRITLPVGFREKLGIKYGDEVEIELVDNKIIITNPNEFDLKSYLENKISECLDAKADDFVIAYQDVYNKCFK